MGCYRWLAGAALALFTLATPAHAQDDDPYAWLEDVEGARSLDWVHAHNATTLAELQVRPDYQAIQARVGALLDTKARFTPVTAHGKYLYNFWTDTTHPRGLWRRTTPAQYRRPEPAWETVLDLDALSAADHDTWTWQDAQCLPPQGERCLLLLSHGGGDAHVVREFDTRTRAFVDGGFALPDAKSRVAWLNADTLLVATDFGPGTLTASGYPRIVRAWKRGTPLASASTVYEGQPGDMSVSLQTPPGYQFIVREIDYTHSEMFLRSGATLARVDKPDDANAYMAGDQLLIELNSDWHVAGRDYPQGALLATDLRAFMAGRRRFDVLFAPTPTSSLDGVTVTRHAVLVNVLDKVRNRLVEFRRAGGAWHERRVDAPAYGQLRAEAFDAAVSDDYILTVTDFLHPTASYLAHAGNDKRTLLTAMPALFDPTPYTTRQFEATSKDGTRVPYFIVMRRDAKLDGSNPTVLNAYGGFQFAMKPNYLGPQGEAWLGHGGVYVLANIRGGGEFGPAWHQAAVKAGRQNAFDDFIAVAEDLIARKVTSPRHLGITGRSNGGLLVGAAFTQRPELFNAVVCEVPLLDMRRYTRLLAGASWTSEYGDPDDPAQWAYIGKYSPYQNVAADKHYPRVLFITSTRDDRVHPAHARKMAAKMQDQGHAVLYWENTEGGHAGVATLAQEVQWWALKYAFLLEQLK